MNTRHPCKVLPAAVAVLACAAPAAAQDPAPCETVASGGSGVFVGVVSNQLFARPDPEYRRCSLSKHADAGVRIIRQTLHWREIERRRGRFDWAHWDTYVMDVARHGIQLMPIIFDAPRWRQARRPRVRWGAMPPAPRAIARFSARLVRRYGPEGSLWRDNPDTPAVPIRVWQVWNEPNLARYWAQRPDAAEYVRVLRAAHDAIKREDPSAEVVAAGLPDSRLWRSVPLYAYVAQMYSAGGRAAFDTLAVNGYAESPRSIMRSLVGVRAVMRRFRDPSPIWLTELGWASAGPRHRFRVGRAGQAKRLGQMLRRLENERWKLRLRGFVHYMWQDAEPYGDTPDFWGLHTGLLDLRGREKPAFRVFRRISRRLRWLG